MLEESWTSSVLLISRGVLPTIGIAISACVGASIIALGVGLAAAGQRVWLLVPARMYIEVFRGTSLFVQLFFAYYVLPLMGFNLTAFEAGVCALSVNSGAYGAEIVRGALRAVPPEQRQACIALNFSRWQALRYVTLPQALYLVIPPMGNLFIDTLKGTAVVSLVGIMELTLYADTIRLSSGSTLIPYTTITILYYLLASAVAFVFFRMEKRTERTK